MSQNCVCRDHVMRLTMFVPYWRTRQRFQIPRSLGRSPEERIDSMRPKQTRSHSIARTIDFECDVKSQRTRHYLSGDCHATVATSETLHPMQYSCRISILTWPNIEVPWQQ